ncbi:hypothetical protein H2248_012272 [Termitomyces sp. 'cryptogamus']|nr:hypothetical protein H2248_012272 [Termitomyces sp. 'cryptogamus']
MSWNSWGAEPAANAWASCWDVVWLAQISTIKGGKHKVYEALINIDFAIVEEARDILLCREGKLVDMAARRKSQWQAGGALRALQPTSTPAVALLVHTAPPPPSKDSEAMDIDYVSHIALRKCYKCAKTGHFMADCLVWLVLLKAAVWEALEAEKKGEEPGPGFV